MKTACVNFTELRFTSDAALRRYLADIEGIWTPEIMKQMADLGLERKSITRIWNQPNQYKLGILWEYSSPEAFKNCQKVIASQILPHAHRYEMVARLFAACRSSTGAATRQVSKCRTSACMVPSKAIISAEKGLPTPRNKAVQLEIEFDHPPFSAARDWQRMICDSCCFADSTKSRCSISPDSTPHWHTPHRPSEHFTSTE